MIRINLNYKQEPLSLAERISKSEIVMRIREEYDKLKRLYEDRWWEMELKENDPPPTPAPKTKTSFSFPSFLSPGWAKTAFSFTTVAIMGMITGMCVTAYYTNYQPSVKLGERTAAASACKPAPDDLVEAATLGLLTQHKLHELASKLELPQLGFPDLSGLELAVEEAVDKTAICYSLNPTEVPNPFSQSRYFKHLKWAEMPDTDYMRTRKHWAKFGAVELINSVALAACATNVYYSYSGNYPVLTVGDISGARGGRLPPHISHRYGIDIDVGHYWYEKGEYHSGFRGLGMKMLTLETLEANWRFVKSLQDAPSSEIEYIFWSQRYVYPLKKYVTEKYGKEEWQKYGKAFYPDRSHGDHMHIRIEIPPKPTEEEKKEKCC
ncbi:penicillin-insensitive murein endopeptidase [Candidatus Woesearchaeota archaeon]|nr:penicillin-insensitive murein endopeptidase [Candidatus Woesearchaeota archaeon]